MCVFWKDERAHVVGARGFAPGEVLGELGDRALFVVQGVLAQDAQHAAFAVRVHERRSGGLGVAGREYCVWKQVWGVVLKNKQARELEAQTLSLSLSLDGRHRVRDQASATTRLGERERERERGPFGLLPEQAPRSREFDGEDGLTALQKAALEQAPAGRHARLQKKRTHAKKVFYSSAQSYEHHETAFGSKQLS